MSERVKVGGNRRIDRILEPAFVEGLADLATEELRRRRDLTRAELEYLSYFRRLLQTRRDILFAERARRQGDVDAAVIDRLPEILSEGPGGGSRGQYLSLEVPDEEIQLARRGAESLVADAQLSDLEAFTDETLDDTIDSLQAAANEVSEDRLAVFKVHDALQDELKERYRADLSQVTTEPR